MIETIINNKYRLLLPEHRHEFYKSNEWERERMDALNRNIQTTDVVADIGAEEGDITALLAKWSAGVYIFEASPGFWPNIKAIFRANGLEDPMGCFVGFVSDKNEMNPPNLNFEGALEGGWPLCANGQVRVGTGFRHLAQETDATPQIMLDTYFHMHQFKPSVINMDIEGSELRALKGAERLLTNEKPLVFVSIHPEFIKEMYDNTAGDVVDYMESLGYRTHMIVRDHEDHVVFYHPQGKEFI